jgi:hypothetical protein
MLLTASLLLKGTFGPASTQATGAETAIKPRHPIGIAKTYLKFYYKSRTLRSFPLPIVLLAVTLG